MMLDLGKCGGIPIGRLPMMLHRVRTLESYDVPLIEEFTSDPRGETFLRYWCDREEDRQRRMIFRTSATELAQYRVGAINTRSLILNCLDQYLFLVDTIKSEVKDVFLLPAKSLPAEYIPEEDSFSEPSSQIINVNEQDVYIDQNPLEGQSGYRQVSEYPRRFLQAYSFNAIFGVNGDVGSLGPIDYKFEGGWVYHTLFTNFDSHVPVQKRAKITQVAFASPGYVRFKVDPQIGADLRTAIGNYLKEQKVIDNDWDILDKWAKQPEKTMSEALATKTLLELCGRVRVDGKAVLQRFDSTISAIKALSSYLRKLNYIAAKDKDKTAMLVGIRRPA
jgi:hypothetical protein